MPNNQASPNSKIFRSQNSLVSIFLTFLKLGCTSFGGPIAHLGYFRDEFVTRLRWLNDRDYADLVALCQFLPGPASSQVGLGLGFARAGFGGAFAAWAGFTLPSALLMLGFGFLLINTQMDALGNWLQGLKVVAVAVVAQALWGMGKSLCPDRQRVTLAALAALLMIWIPGVAGQLTAMVLGGLVGWLWLGDDSTGSADLPSSALPGVGSRLGFFLLVLFAALLLVLPLLAGISDNFYLGLFDSFYRAGSLVFGGGHVVLPLLETEFVANGQVSEDLFLAGYGAAQALPGPLFTFAGYLGAVTAPGTQAVMAGGLALLAIFLPGALLLLGILPLWAGARKQPKIQKIMKGVNAAVVGLLLAAFYDPVWTSAINTPADFSLALAAFVAMFFWRLPPWLVVALCASVTALGW